MSRAHAHLTSTSSHHLETPTHLLTSILVQGVTLYLESFGYNRLHSWCDKLTDTGRLVLYRIMHSVTRSKRFFIATLLLVISRLLRTEIYKGSVMAIYYGFKHVKQKLLNC